MKVKFNQKTGIEPKEPISSSSPIFSGLKNSITNFLSKVFSPRIKNIELEAEFIKTLNQILDQYHTNTYYIYDNNIGSKFNPEMNIQLFIESNPGIYVQFGILFQEIPPTNQYLTLYKTEFEILKKIETKLNCDAFILFVNTRNNPNFQNSTFWRVKNTFSITLDGRMKNDIKQKKSTILQRSDVIEADNFLSTIQMGVYSVLNKQKTVRAVSTLLKESKLIYSNENKYLANDTNNIEAVQLNKDNIKEYPSKFTPRYTIIINKRP